MAGHIIHLKLKTWHTEKRQGLPIGYIIHLKLNIWHTEKQQGCLLPQNISIVLQIGFHTVTLTDVVRCKCPNATTMYKYSDEYSTGILRIAVKVTNTSQHYSRYIPIPR